MGKILSLAVGATILSFVVICKPEWLAENSFLSDFVSEQLLALLAVMMTITFASAANIHLVLNRIIANVFRDNIQDGHRRSEPARKEINEDVWLMFGGFVFVCISLLFKGGLDGELVLAIVHGVAVFVIFLYILVFYDIYRVVFRLAAVPGLTDAPPTPSAAPPQREGAQSDGGQSEQPKEPAS